jgi:nucleotide-binding universal stress UspA family protein
MRLEMYTILVAVDGSQLAGRALAFAVERARIRVADIVLVFVVNRQAVADSVAVPWVNVDPTPLLNALEAEGDVVLRAAESLVASAGVTVKAVKLDGAPGDAILQYALQTSVDLIVMGTHGRRGFNRFATGSTAEDVIRGAMVPVFVIPARYVPSAQRAPLARALVAVDGSPAAELALDFAATLAKSEGTLVTLCTVVEQWAREDSLDSSVFCKSELESKAAAELAAEHTRFASLGFAADAIQRSGDAANEIVSAASDAGADCIVIGTHGRAGIPRFLIGSVAEGVLRTSHLPVCTVRHR